MKPILIGLLIYTATDVSAGAHIISLQGDVKVRRGLEETWLRAAEGMLLEDMDSILNGETAEAVLEMDDGRTFRLGSNAILDIADLRRITEQQLFLYLTAKKIQNLDPPGHGGPVRIQNVSTVRAENRSKSGGHGSDAADPLIWKQKANAALAMIEQAYYPNAVVKLHKILDAHASTADKARLHLYLGRSFEAMEDRGRALEAYQTAAAHCTSGQGAVRTESLDAVKRLKND